jgi:hypothetical protein
VSRITILLITATALQFLHSASAQPQRKYAMLGNNLLQFIPDKNQKGVFIDPVDDTLFYKKVVDKFYTDRSGKVYLLTTCSRPFNPDTMVFYEYYKDVSNFIDLKSYKSIGRGFFRNKGKVHYWAANSDGEYPVEVIGADPKTFVPFDSVGGGKDSLHVFYGGAPDDFHIIPGADPKTIRLLNPERGCWNCGNCYFIDKNAVYFGLVKINGADPKTFRLINKESIDATDKNGKYFDGKRITR